MEIKRAIKLLDCMAAQTTPLPLGDDGIKAVEMAIKALEKQAGIERALERLGKKINNLHNANWNAAIEEAIEIIKEEVG